MLGAVIISASSAGVRAEVPAAALESPTAANVEAATPSAAPTPVEHTRGRRKSALAVLPMAAHPFSADDLALMLRSGFSSPEIIEAVGEKQLVSEMGPQQVATLRAQGADNKLLSYLQSLPLYAAPPTASRQAATAPAPPPVLSPAGASLASPTVLTATDHAARDREIQVLKERIDALDEQIRRIRTDPKGTLGTSHRYQGNDNGINQPAVMKYLDQLDKERDALRRQKWQLEGR